MKALLSGNEAIARGAFEADCAVATAYPGTPSTEILETIVSRYPEITSAWSVNEKTALETAYGASMAGGRSIVCMKHVGLNVAADPLFTAAYSGVKRGLVIVTADDPSMHSSQDEQDNRLYGKFAKIPVLEPSDSQEAKEFTKQGFTLSEEFDTPVILRTTTLISHTQTVVNLEEPQRQPTTYQFEFADAKFVNLPTFARQHHQQVEERLQRLSRYNSESSFNRIETRSDEVGIITCGLAYQYVRESFPEASVLKIGMVFPLPMDLIRKFAAQVAKLYIIEELEPFLEEPIRAAGIPVAMGKDRIPICFELSVDILRRIATDETVPEVIKPPLPPRPPVLCPGCPHRGVYFSLNKNKVTVNGDIGCYTLGFMPPLSSVHTCICMGASITNANGFEIIKQRAGQHPQTVATIGDSTFMHSGITGLLDAVYNKIPTTVIILNNDITAMTGHQPNPVSGMTAGRQSAPKLDLVSLCHSLGIRRVDKVNPYDLKEFQSVLNDHLNLMEPSVIITNQPCILLPQVKSTRYFRIESDICKRCKQCLKLGCPAISFQDNRVSIDTVSCSGCSLCAQVCPFGAIKEVSRESS
ncbi:MAG: indolepyruvate ferredoxin oxidoreductase subunit alpha [Candidatus Delongbacteria bacterium]|nr:indolepyruvate ferredoxin oxidoreductase subunit alpha [Candidatus Delongbacteria bacterium]